MTLPLIDLEGWVYGFPLKEGIYSFCFPTNIVNNKLKPVLVTIGRVIKSHYRWADQPLEVHLMNDEYMLHSVVAESYHKEILVPVAPQKLIDFLQSQGVKNESI